MIQRKIVYAWEGEQEKMQAEINRLREALKMALCAINDDGGKNTEVLNDISLKLAEQE